MRVILVETTRPVRMRPRIETSLVKGHFLSTSVCIVCKLLRRHKLTARTNVASVNRLWGRLKSKSHIFIPPLLLSRHFFSAYPSYQFCSSDQSWQTRVETQHTAGLRVLEEGLLLECLLNLPKIRLIPSFTERATLNKLVQP